MSKSLHSRHNKIFLKKLRELRESRNLRQADLAKLLGRSQGTVSNVERGETSLDVIELREWLDALDYKFMNFLRELDAELRRQECLRLRIKIHQHPVLDATRQPRQRGQTHAKVVAVQEPNGDSIKS